MPDREKKEYVKLWLSYAAYFEPLSDAEVGRLALAMIQYKSSGTEPKFSGNERFTWPAIKRDIDEAAASQEAAAKKHRESGALGGRPPRNQNGFRETNLGQGQRTMDKGHSSSNDEDRAPARGNPAVAAVLSDYMNRINPSCSPSTLDELQAYAEELGEAVCKRVFDIALDNKKTSWSYIRAILRDKAARGVKCLADWDAIESAREAEKKSGKQAKSKKEIEELRRNIGRRAADYKPKYNSDGTLRDKEPD